jgi:hypothetical protein
MLQNLSKDIREYYLRAEECERLAETARTPSAKSGLSCDGASLVIVGPQLRIFRTAIEFHRALQEARTSETMSRSAY